MTGTVGIAPIFRYLSEIKGFTHNGILAGIIICMGGAFLFRFVTLMFGIGFRPGGPGAILAAIGALILVPTQ